MNLSATNVRRLKTVAAASISGLLLTTIFSYCTRISANRKHGRAPIARLTTMIADTYSRPAEDFIWHNVEINEDLYPGDYIRTAMASTATIEFLNQQGRIDIDENSMILIEEVDGQAGINFLNGSMLVTATGKDREAIAVRAGDEKLNLSKASVTLNTNSKGAVDVSLVSGSIKDLNEKSSQKLIAKMESKIRTTSPLPGQQILKLESENSPTTFLWETDPSLTQNISLWIGDSPSTLKSVATVPAANSKISTSLQPGTHYWQLRSEQRESAILKVEVKKLHQPRLIAPINSEKVRVKNASEVSFSWSMDPEWSEAELEISENASFKGSQKLNVGNHDLAKLPLPANKTYFWRVRTSLDEKRSLTSSSSTFSVTSAEVTEETAATAGQMTAPTIDPKIPGVIDADKYGSFSLAWSAVPEAKGYIVSLRTETGTVVQEPRVAELSLNMQKVRPGMYVISVRAYDQEQKEGPESETRRVFVDSSGSVEAPKNRRVKFGDE